MSSIGQDKLGRFPFPNCRPLAEIIRAKLGDYRFGFLFGKNRFFVRFIFGHR
jgi:hypothetical protein